jgi:hypothetical protein
LSVMLDGILILEVLTDRVHSERVFSEQD